MPQTAMRLVAAEWARIQHDVGLNKGAYGTARFRARSRFAPRTVAGRVALPAGYADLGPVVIEHLDPATATPYIAIGLEFASPGDVELADASSRLASALAVLSPVPDLTRTMGGLLGAIHVLKSPGTDYDVSHSDPDIPFSVFIGVSSKAGPLDRLRLAEELVHECMHLLLTLLEAERPLVQGTEELHPSPWRTRLRPTRGVLHGFYVFSALDVLFTRLLTSNVLNGSEVAHVRFRRQEIAAELELVVDALATSGELTQDGGSLVAELTSNGDVFAVAEPKTFDTRVK